MFAPDFAGAFPDRHMSVHRGDIGTPTTAAAPSPR